MKNDIDSFIKEIEEPKEGTFVGMQKQWQDREALSRILSLVMALQVFATALIARMFFGGMGLGVTVIALVSGIGLCIFLHIFFKNTGWINLFYEFKKREIKKELEGQTNMVKAVELFSENEKMFYGLKRIMKKLSKNKNILPETIAKAERNLELIEKYENEYDFFVIKEIKANSFEMISEIRDENLSKQIRDIFSYFEQMRFSDPEKYDGLGYGFEDDNSLMHSNTKHHLENWMKINSRTKTDKNSIDAVIFNAMQIIRLTSFSSEIINEENKNKIVLELQDFISFYQTTIEKIKQLSPEEQSGLEYEISVLNEVGRYAIMYYDAMSNMFNIDILSGYRISRGNIFYLLEVMGIMRFVRTVFGIQTGIDLSSQRFRKSMKYVKETGNTLINGLYDEHFDNDIENYLHKKSHPKYFHLGISESWKVRDMLIRLFPLAFFISSLIQSISAGGPGASWEQILFSFVKGIGLSIALHWLPILYGYLKTGHTTGKFIKSIKKAFGLKEGEGVNINKQKLLKKQIERLAKVPKGEMPDLIIVSASAGMYTQKSMEDSISSVTNFGNFKKTKIAYVISEQSGSGNSILSVYEFLRSEEFKTQYPELATRPLSELKIAVININSAKPDDIMASLNINILNKRTTATVLSLLNAVCLIQDSKKEKGNMVIVNPSYMYIGDLTATGNITLLGSKVSYGQMQKQKLPLMISTPSDSHTDAEQLRKIYSRYSDDKMTNIIVKNMLRKTYNLSNKTIEQMPTFSGIMSISFDEPSKLRQIEKILLAMKEYEHFYEGKKFPVDMLSHLMIPLIMLINGEDIFVYLESLQFNPKISQEEKTSYDRFFFGLFKKIEEAYKTDNQLDKNDIVFTHGINSQMSIVQPLGQEYKAFMRFLQILTEWQTPARIPAGGDKHFVPDIERENFSGKTNAIFIAEDLTMAVKQHIRAFNNNETGLITVVPYDKLESPKNTGIVLNVPVNGFNIQARVVCEIFSDAYGQQHVLISFEPLADGEDAERYDIIRDLRSYETTDENLLTKKIFLGRAVLSFIKELKVSQNSPVLRQSGLFFLKNFNPSLIFSFDNAGVFAEPDLLEDEFAGNDGLEKIKHISVGISEKKDMKIPAGKIKFSTLFGQYDFKEGVSLNDLENIISDYGIDRKTTDSKTLFSDTKRYYEEFMNGIKLAFSENTENIAIFQIEDARIIPTIKMHKFSDISNYIEFFGTGVFKSVILKDIFQYEEILNFDMTRICAEINRLDNPNLNKLKFLIDEQKPAGAYFSLNDNATVFVLSQLLNYVRDNPEENRKFSDFVESRSQKFVKNLQHYTAWIMAGADFKGEETINELKERNIIQWNKYYGMCLYMQYISYRQYATLQDYLAINNIELYLSDDILKEKNILSVDLFSMQSDEMKGKLKDSKMINVDISYVFEKIRAFEAFKEISSLKRVIISQSDPYKAGQKDFSVFAEMIASDTAENKIKMMDISGLENVDGKMIFEYVRTALNNSGMSASAYSSLYFYLNKLETAYKFVPEAVKRTILLRLRGFVEELYISQIETGFYTKPYIPHTENIVAMLASA
jgi:hypothetical protein